jgi:hypothetical protein
MKNPCLLGLAWRPEEQLLALTILALAAAGAGVVLLWAWLRPKRDRERERRLRINAEGRMRDATINDFTGSTIFYTYELRGVTYLASQDVAALSDGLPADLMTIIGPATIKYLPADPGNSIIICEEWSGLRTAARPTPSSRPIQIQEGA